MIGLVVVEIIENKKVGLLKNKFMSMKVRIDEEIENLKVELDSISDTSSHHMTATLKEIQNCVLATHARLEESMEYVFLCQISYLIKDVSSRSIVSGAIEPLLSYLTFKNKVDFLEKHSDVGKNIIKNLSKVNSIRIEFAHPKGVVLRDKYNYGDFKGKVRIRNLYRCLTKAEREMNEYFKNKYFNSKKC